MGRAPWAHLTPSRSLVHNFLLESSTARGNALGRQFNLLLRENDAFPCLFSSFHPFPRLEKKEIASQNASSGGDF